MCYGQLCSPHLILYSPHPLFIFYPLYSIICYIPDFILHSVLHTPYPIYHLLPYILISLSVLSSSMSHLILCTVFIVFFFFYTTNIHVVILFSPLYVIVRSVFAALHTVFLCPGYSLLLRSTLLSLHMLHSTQHLSHLVCYSLSSPLRSALFLSSCSVSHVKLCSPSSVLCTISSSYYVINPLSLFLPTPNPSHALPHALCCIDQVLPTSLFASSTLSSLSSMPHFT